MTRFLTATALILAAQIGATAASARSVLTVADHAPAAACAPVMVLETRGEWSRVTLGETFGWVLTAELDAARCDADPEVALDASYRPREAQPYAYA